MINHPKKLLSKDIVIRQSTPGDAKKIVDWRNKDFVRNNLIESKKISVKEHLNWFKKNVTTGRVVHYIISFKGLKDIGVIFLKNIDYMTKTAELGMFIGEKKYLNRSLGSQTLKMLADHYFFNDLITNIILIVKVKNKPAIKSYLKSNFYIKREFVLSNEKYFELILRKDNKT